MSFLHATDDFKTGNWSLEISGLTPPSADLFIGFTNDAPVVEFKNLKFGYKLKSNNAVTQESSFPPANVTYVRSDQPYLVSDRVNLIAEEDYVLYLWCENDGKWFEKTFEFTTPRPAQPFESWVWNEAEKFWEAPVAYPDDDELYIWDEDTTSWVLDEE